ncbi:MAG: permease [Calditrichaceae bacterium]|nr:permease [Calditrichaceae bacterium]
MEYITSFIEEIIYFFNEISIYLVFGFVVAGILHVLFPDSIVRKHLGRGSFGSVLKSTIFGIPLPLCSCGVVPVATSLRRSGASKGSVVSFLISTPQVGADSFMITYSLIGWVFAIFRIIASLITAFFAGILINIFDKEKVDPSAHDPNISVPETSYRDRIKSFPNYIEYELFGSIANYLVIGLIIAGLIGVFVPDGFFETYLGNSFLSMLLMLVVGIPMYVCASASTPIAASLLMKGISPGAALVFLLTGPATNAVSFSAVTKIVGKKSTTIYMASIAVVSLALGYALNLFSDSFGIMDSMMHHHHETIPFWLKITGSILMIMMFTWYYVKLYIVGRFMKTDNSIKIDKIQLDVQGMTCMHCAGTVKKAVESVKGISEVNVMLNNNRVEFLSDNPGKINQVKQKIKAAGYEV